MRPQHFSSAWLLAALLACLPALIGPATSGSAASGPLVRITRVDVDASHNPPHMMAHVSVSDSTGIPISGLEAKDFALTEDGKPVQNLAVSTGTTADPLSVALALDTSGSMLGKPLADMQDAARAFVGVLGPNDPVAAFGFGGAVPDEIGLSTDHNAALDAISSLRAGGNTPLDDAVFAAVTAVAASPSGRRAVLVMTDGGENSSANTLDDVIRHAQDTNVPVFTVGLGDLDPAPLQRLADTTGGRFVPAPTSAQLSAIFPAVATQLRQEYVLAYDGEGSNQDSTRTLQVVANVNGQTNTANSDPYPVKATVSQHVTPQFVTPTDGQRVRGNVSLTADVEPVMSARGVRFLVDNKPVGTVNQPPFTFIWQTRGVLIGGHILRVEATGIDGQTTSAQETVDLASAESGISPVLGIAGLMAVLAAVGAAIVIGRSRRADEPVPIDATDDFGSFGEDLPFSEQTVRAGNGNGAARAWSDGEPPGWLIEERPDGMSWPWPLQPGETLIGREVTNPNILLDDIDASRQHATIHEDGGALVFEDLGPTNPSRINGRPYAGPHPLQDGDELVIGSTRLVYHTAEPAQN